MLLVECKPICETHDHGVSPCNSWAFVRLLTQLPLPSGLLHVRIVETDPRSESYLSRS